MASTSESLLTWREQVRSEALALGFTAAGFTTAAPLSDATRRRWTRWLSLARAGRMAYLLRSRPRRTHPCDLMPEAESLIMVAASYYDGDHPPPPADTTAAKIARYAWGRDYHVAIRERLQKLGEGIAGGAAGFGFESPVTYRAVTDSAPLDERNFAVRAGLGFIGKNTLLLHPVHGSWMLLGALLVSVPFPEDPPPPSLRGAPPEYPSHASSSSEQPGNLHAAYSCAACRKCLDACPTAAFAGPYELNPTQCISYLTIEQREPIPPPLSDQLSGWAFGCDICQEVCPYNATPAPLRIPELRRSQGIGPYLTGELLSSIPSGKSLERKWGHTPVPRPGLTALRRNLAAARAPQPKKNADEPGEEP